MTGIHPLVQQELDKVSGAECPFCAVMGRINWKIIHEVAINQSAACEHCKDAPEMVSFLHDLVTVYKKKGKPFDKNNFEKWCRIAADYINEKNRSFECTLELLDFGNKVLDVLDSSKDIHSAFDKVKKLIAKIDVKKSDIHNTIAAPGETHTHKSDIRDRQEDPAKFDKDSFRTRKIGEQHSIVLACPKGSWDGKRCKVNQVVQSIIHHHGKSKNDPMMEYIERDLAKMIEAILETDKHNVEHGFCGDSGIIKGKETDLMLPYCPKKLHFHTHNSGAMYPSNTDFRSSSAQNAIVECIGTHDGIACYHPHTQEQVYKS